MGSILKRTALFSSLLLLLSAALYAGLPFWLESPSRTNPHDPKNPGHFTPTIAGTPTITPTYSVSPTISATFTASPTFSPTPSFSPTSTWTYSRTPTPGAGIQVYVKKQDGTPVANSWVMLNSNAAGAQITNAGGLAVFPPTALPLDIHAFSPRAGGSPLYQPRVVSFIGANSSSVTLDAFSNTYYPVTSHSVYYQVTSTLYPGATYEAYENSYSAVNNYSHGYGRSTILPINQSAPCYTNSRHYYCGIERDPSLNIVSALFIAPFSTASTDLTVTASTSTSGHSPLLVTWSPTNVGFWPTAYYNFELNPGLSPSEWYSSEIQSAQSTGAPFTLEMAYPSGISNYRYTASSYAGSYTGSRYVRSAIPLSSVNMPMPGKVDFVSLPNSGSLTYSFQLTGGTAPDLMASEFFSFGDDGKSSEWALIGLPTNPSTFTMTLPSAYPAAIPPNYVFQSGLTFTAGAIVMQMWSPYNYSSLMVNIRDFYQWQSQNWGNSSTW